MSWALARTLSRVARGDEASLPVVWHAGFGGGYGARATTRASWRIRGDAGRVKLQSLLLATAVMLANLLDDIAEASAAATLCAGLPGSASIFTYAAEFE